MSATQHGTVLAASGGDGPVSPYCKSLPPARGQFKVIFPAAARIEEKNRGQYPKQQLKDKLIEHKQYIDGIWGIHPIRFSASKRYSFQNGSI
jgi:hypothetical protein